MVGDDLALLRAHHALLFESGDQAIDRLVEVRHLDRGLVLARGEQRRLVHQVREVGAGKAGRARGDDAQVDRWRQLDLLGVDAQDLFAALDVRLVDEHLPIEAPGTEQGRVEHFRPVGRGHDDDRLARVEAVHLGQQLVQRLLALLVRSHRALHARAAERVELVDEDDARRLLLGLREEVADPGRADADEHLDELGSAQAEERHLGFAGDRAGQQRLARAGRADEQHALRNAAAERGVLLRVLQELDDLLQLLLGLVDARHVGEADLDVVFGEHAVLAAGKRHHAAFGAAHPPEEEAPDREQQQEWDHPAEDFREPAADELARVLHARRRRAPRAASGSSIRVGVELVAAVALGLEACRGWSARRRDLGDLAAADRLLELAVRDRLAGRAAGNHAWPAPSASGSRARTRRRRRAGPRSSRACGGRLVACRAGSCPEESRFAN